MKGSPKFCQISIRKFYKGKENLLNILSNALNNIAFCFLNFPRHYKILISIGVDFFCLFSAFLASYLISDSPKKFAELLGLSYLFFSIILTIVVFIRLGLYRAVVRFLGTQALKAVLTGVFVSGTLIYFLSYLLHKDTNLAITINYMFFAMLLIGSSRLFVRGIVNSKSRKSNHKVLIYGAGASGRQLLLALENSVEFRAAAFVDDDPSLQNVLIKDVRVYHPEQISKIVEKYGITRILLALPSASRAARSEIVSRLEPLGLPVLTIPGMADIVDGKMKIDELQDVKIEDLLGRDPVAPISSLMIANITGKVVMVTGAGGSIGSELCRQILLQNPKKLILFEISEYALYEIDKSLLAKTKSAELDVQIIPILGSVLDRSRVQEIMRSFRVDTVYHAAAYKHVPLVEFNVVEGVKNNVFGTWYTAEAAVAAGVKSFVLVSTDKAVRPTNVMGTTKRIAELVLQGLAQRQKNTRFCMVRFGNVLGSSGSVVPLFRKQIKQGGPITLTHEDITRYFMTIPEAAQLVIQAGAMGHGGDVFVLDMGEPVRIYDLALKMIKLSGLAPKTKQCPNGDIEIKIVGLRPGEKLYEELLIGGEEQPTRHPRIKTANEVYLKWPELIDFLHKLSSACDSYDLLSIRQLMLTAPTGFNPTDGIGDLLFKENLTSEQANTSYIAAVS